MPNRALLFFIHSVHSSALPHRRRHVLSVCFFPVPFWKLIGPITKHPRQQPLAVVTALAFLTVIGPNDPISSAITMPCSMAKRTQIPVSGWSLDRAFIDLFSKVNPPTRKYQNSSAIHCRIRQTAGRVHLFSDNLVLAVTSLQCFMLLNHVLWSPEYLYWRRSASRSLGIIPPEFMMVLYPLLFKFRHDVGLSGVPQGDATRRPPDTLSLLGRWVCPRSSNFTKGCGLKGPETVLHDLQVVPRKEEDSETGPLSS